MKVHINAPIVIIIGSLGLHLSMGTMVVPPQAYVNLSDNTLQHSAGGASREYKGGLWGNMKEIARD